LSRKSQKGGESERARKEALHKRRRSELKRGGRGRMWIRRPAQESAREVVMMREKRNRKRRGGGGMEMGFAMAGSWIVQMVIERILEREHF
jgi:hypothetical protein